MNVRNAAATLVGFAIAGVVLLGLAYLIGTGEILDALGKANPVRVLMVPLAIFAWLCVWGVALQVILAAVGVEISVIDAVLVHAGAAFANHISPFGQAGGEPIAAWLVTETSDAEFERALAAMTSFDTINVVPSLLFALVGLGYYAVEAVLVQRIQYLAAGVLVLAVTLPLFGVVAWRKREALERRLVGLVVPPLRFADRVLPKFSLPGRAAVEGMVEGFFVGIERIATDRRRLVIAVVLSASGWALQAAGLWFAFWALGIVIPPYIPLFVVTLGAFAGALPTPGGLGGVETLQITLLVATTTVVAPTITAAVAISRVGGFFFTTTVGAAAIGILKIRSNSV
ncbi:flippase-like domain-containing protein [Haloarchaeobius litoreus]|uniref:Flippase-like domain-containing protein n=1 Tax=Haloarchaeobius litoreus TaxID=755306 RepID=A0ABD6DR21_9EURY